MARRRKTTSSRSSPARGTSGTSSTSGTSGSSAQADRKLLALARAALRRSYSPYSGVQVGAALLGTDGRVFAACNVENAAYPLSVCAERNAIAVAISEGARRFLAIAIATNQPRAVMPCGGCRQVLHEFAPHLRVLVAAPRGEVLECGLDELLPDAFGPDVLEERAPASSRRAGKRRTRAPRIR